MYIYIIRSLGLTDQVVELFLATIDAPEAFYLQLSGEISITSHHTKSPSCCQAGSCYQQHPPVIASQEVKRMELHINGLFKVLEIGGRDYINPQTKARTIPGI